MADLMSVKTKMLYSSIQVPGTVSAEETFIWEPGRTLNYAIAISNSSRTPMALLHYKYIPGVVATLK